MNFLLINKYKRISREFQSISLKFFQNFNKIIVKGKQEKKINKIRVKELNKRESTKQTVNNTKVYYVFFNNDVI